MVHTIALETREWEVEAEAAEVFLVLRLEIAIHKFTLETNAMWRSLECRPISRNSNLPF